ncbi:MAG: GDP-L-fucose synthase [Variovorax sp.]|nr:MAG: GDP-L-fucose synthase [Variovorax sp.]
MTMTNKIFIAGHRGMVGGAIVRALANDSAARLVTRTHDQLDLKDASAVRAFFEAERPDMVYLAAARVGGIHANNTYPADFIYDNLMIQANVIHEAWRSGTRRLLFLGSSCIYPKFADQPITEDALLTGKLESTNEPYAIAKIAGIKLCESYNRQHGVDFRSAMPTNLYGPGDNYHPENSHVLPALIRRFHEAHEAGAPSVTIWGTGTPRREFLHVDDMAAACVHLMHLGRDDYARATSPMSSHINVGCGSDVTIAELARIVADVVGYQGSIEYDTSKPDGTPRKLLDVNRLATLGWVARISLADGIRTTYQEFLNRTTTRA